MKKDLINKHEEKLYNILIELYPGAIVKREYKFHLPKENEKPRRWRFDIAFPEYTIAFEVEGGTWVGGRHINPIGYAKDCEKYNTATAQGWKVYRLVPAMITAKYLKNLLF